MTDQYAWWREAIAGNVGEIIDGEPRSGFYRTRRKSEQAKAVAYWIDTKNGSLRCRVNGADVPEQEALELWPFAAKEPIAHESFKTFTETGKWPDMDEAALSTLPGQNQVIGHNNPPTDPFDILKEQIENARGGLKQYAKITTEETAKAAQSLRARLLELGGDADKKREALKRPHIDAGNEIQRKWKPIIDLAQDGADALRKAISAFVNEQDRKEKARIAEEERKRREAADKAFAAGKTPEPERQEPAPPPPPPAPIKGGYGRGAGVRTVNVVTIADQDKVYAAFRDRQEVKDLLLKLATQSVNAGHEVDGTTVTKEKDVR